MIYFGNGNAQQGPQPINIAINVSRHGEEGKKGGEGERGEGGKGRGKGGGGTPDNNGATFLWASQERPIRSHVRLQIK